MPETVREIAWKAQLRLCARFRRLVAAGKHSNLATAAIAREIAAFLWEIGRAVSPAGRPPRRRPRPTDELVRHGSAARRRGRGHGGEPPTLARGRLAADTRPIRLGQPLTKQRG